MFLKLWNQQLDISIKKPIVGLLILSATGCTSLNLTNSISEIESPVMQANRQGVGIEVSANGGKELILVEDPSARPLSYDKNNLKTSTALITRTGVLFYLTRGLFIGGGIQNSSAVFGKVKLNLLRSNPEDLRSNRYFFTMNIEGTYQQAKKTGSTDGATGSSGYPWEGTVQNVSGTAGLSLGYQISKSIIPYIGFNYQKFQTSGVIKHYVSTNGSDPGGEYNLGVISGNVRILGAGIELRPTRNFFIAPIIQYFILNWSNVNIQEMTSSIKFTYSPD